jgi:predicted amidophosphoribosyltransferase
VVDTKTTDAIMRRKHHRRNSHLSHICLHCGKRPAVLTDLCAECGGALEGWRGYCPEVDGAPPFYGANWVPLDGVTLRKVGHP